AEVGAPALLPVAVEIFASLDAVDVRPQQAEPRPVRLHLTPSDTNYLLFGGTRLSAHVVTDRHVALDDRVAERAEALDLDLDHVARLDRTRVGRRPRQDHVTRLQRDRPRDVRDEVG